MAAAKTWFITGCSTGLGRALAEHVLARGDRAIVTARRPETVQDLAAAYPDTARIVPLDISDAAQITTAAAAGEAAFGGIDVLVNNAAYILNGAVEEIVPAEYAALFDTNLFGPIELMRATLGGMRARGSGHIVNISSMAAITGVIGFGDYAASKAGLVAVSEALAEEVRPFGVRVTIVELGGHATKGSANMIVTDHPIAAYADTVGARQDWIRANAGREMGDAALAARAIATIVDAEAPPLRLPLGRDSVERTYAKLDSRRAEMDAWRTLAESTARVVA